MDRRAAERIAKIAAVIMIIVLILSTVLAAFGR